MKFVGKGEYDERFEEMKSMVENNPNLLFVIIVDEGRNFVFLYESSRNCHFLILFIYQNYI